MKTRFSYSLAAALSILSLRNYLDVVVSLPNIPPKPRDRYAPRFRKGKSGGGCGGAGTITRHGIRTKQPEGYYSQQTPVEHMHACARLRAMANIKIPVRKL